MNIPKFLSRLHPKRLQSGWRALPHRKRVQWIAAVILIFAGAEILVVAPAILELAVLIDAFGLLFVLAAAKNYVGTSLLLLMPCVRSALAPIRTSLKAFNRTADLCLKLPSRWLLTYLHTRAILARATVFATALVGCAMTARTAAKFFS